MAKVRWAVQCSATCKRTGRQCSAYAMTGGYVCWGHGGATPAVRAAAARRWEFAKMMRRIERRSGSLVAAFMSAEFAPDPATYRKHGNADERATWHPRFIPVNLDELARGQAVQQGDRVAALAELARIEHVLSQMGSWLDDLGHERAAVLIEDAWRDVLAAQALIDRDPARVTPSFSPCKHPVPAAPPRYVRLA